MTRRKNNKNIILTKSEKTLILKSTICEKDKELKEFLKKFPLSISNQHLILIKDKNERIYNTLNSNEAVSLLIDRSSSEWKSKEPLGNKPGEPCQLCGNKQSQVKHMIINIMNENKLEVGSECINKFEKIANYNGESFKTIETWYKENPEKLNRLGIFNSKFNGGKDITTHWKEKYNSFEIEFPKDYDNKLNKIVKKADKIYNNYIKGKIEESELYRFQMCINEFDYLYNKKCKRFVEENKNNKYICTKSMANVLENKGFIETLNTIKENECNVSKGLTKHITDSEFIEKFESNIFDTFDKIDLKLNKIDVNSIQFKYKYEILPNSNPIVLKMKLDIFAFHFSNLFFQQINLNKKDTFNFMELEYDYDNINNFLDILDYILNKNLKRRKYYVKYNIDLHDKRLIEIKKYKTNMYINIKIEDILNKYTDVLFNDEKIRNEIENSKWTTYAEKDKYDIGDITSNITHEEVG